MSDETNAQTPAENSEAEQKVRGRPFSKGTSGNPGGRPKAVAELQERLRKLAPKAIEEIEKALSDIDPEELKAIAIDMGPAFARSFVRTHEQNKLKYIDTVLAYTLPKPKELDAFKEPNLAKAPGATTTIGMFSEARALLSTELARIRGVSDAGHPLTESAAARLTECVRQLAMLAEEEAKLLKVDPFASLSDDELRQRLADAN